MNKTQTWTWIYVDLCQMDANLSTTMTIQMYIHARNYKKILHRNLRKEMSALTDTQGLRLVLRKV